MYLKVLKFILFIITASTLTLMSRGFAYPLDSRGFPITQSPAGSFGTPTINNPSPLGAPMVTLPPVSNQITPIKSHRRPSYIYYPYVTPYYYYFDSNGYSYFSNQNDDDESFYYSSSANTNISSQTTYQTTNTFFLPSGRWISAYNGNVPDKAFVYQTESGIPSYYCRTQYKSRFYYGVLTPNVGCYIKDQSAIIRFNQYEVLVSLY